MPQQHSPWGSTYDEQSQTLVVRFPNGREYSFDNVPPDLAQRFVQAEDKGTFYNQYIRGQY